jgi:hypothetical protein
VSRCALHLMSKAFGPSNEVRNVPSPISYLGFKCSGELRVGLDDDFQYDRSNCCCVRCRRRRRRCPGRLEAGSTCSKCTMLQLVVGNAGPTTARNVRILIDPPIPAHPKYAGATIAAQKRVRDGILSLAPGRTIRWSLGRGFDLLEDEGDETSYSLRVTGEGPYGALEPVEIEIRPRDWREARDAPDGNLHFVRKEIENLWVKQRCSGSTSSRRTLWR